MTTCRSTVLALRVCLDKKSTDCGSLAAALVVFCPLLSERVAAVAHFTGPRALPRAERPL